MALQTKECLVLAVLFVYFKAVFSCAVNSSVILHTMHLQIDPKMCVASHSVAITCVLFCLYGGSTSYNVFRITQS